MNAPLPQYEARRLATLHRYEVLDTPPEAAFDDITRLAAQICQAPIVLLSLLDASRQWFKSRHGLAATELPREHAFCAHAILQPNEVMEVPDAEHDPRFVDNPLVTGEPHIRFYAGAPLLDDDGMPLGTLCVIDHVPRELSAEQLEALRLLGRHVVAHLEARRRARELAAEAAERRRLAEQAARAHRLLEVIRAAQAEFVAVRDPRPTFATLLSGVLGVTDSEYGFIGEVLRSADRRPSLKLLAITPGAAQQDREWDDPQTLFGAVLRTERTVLVNDTAADDSRGGLPADLPPPRSFLGLPCFHAGELLGMIGVANRPGGYDEALVGSLVPLLATCGGLLSAMHAERHRREAEQALRTSEKHLRELAETLDDVFWTTDPTHRVLYVSPAYERVWGRTCASAYEDPRSWLESVHPDDRGRMARAVQAQRAEPVLEEEYRIVRPDGAVRWIRDHVYLIRDAAGELERLVGVAKDITARRLAEDALRATNERYARQEVALLTMTRACAMGHSSVSEMMREVTRVAATTLEVERVSVWRYGRGRGELVCEDVYELGKQTHASGVRLAAADYPRYFRALAEADIIVAHDAHVDARTAEFADSYLRPLGITSMLDAPIHVGGDVAGVLCSEHVGPPRKWTADEQTFAIAVANLVSLVLAHEERQRVEEQLRQSQKMEAIGQLAGGVAHDFNNVLLAILLQLDLIGAEEALSTEVREGLEQVQTSAQRAAALTRQLLLFSRRQVMQTRDIDLNDVVAGLGRMLQRIIGEDVRLVLQLHPAPLLTRADARMLEQVLMNLAVNARDAMPAGGRLQIGTTQTLVDEEGARRCPDAAPGAYVCFSVSDSGAGIPREVLPRIFEPFFTTKEPGKGTGLGLATALGIVKEHRGWLEVRSEVGRGTTVEVFLPAAAAATDCAAVAPDARPRGGQETLLVVEDDRAVLRLMRGLLLRHGYRVIEALNGVDALRLWEQHGHQVALLVTDLVMPAGIDGHELARRCRADRPDLKVIYMSGYSAEIAGRELKLTNRENFLQKPFPPEQLLAAVRRCLDGPD